MMKYLFGLLILLGGGVAAQVGHLHVRVLAKAYEDSIVVRWSPTDAVAWGIGKDSGYFVTRIDYTDAQHPVSQLLSVTPFKPMTLDQMKAHLERNDRYAAIAAQAMYGNDFRMTKQQPKGYAKQVKQGHDALNLRWTFAMQAADLSSSVASALALRWVDKDVKKGSRYVYLLTVHSGNKSYIIDSAATMLMNIKESQAAVPDGLEAYGFDRQVELHWYRRQRGNFSAYYIQRSEDEGKTFKALNELPYYSPDKTPEGAKNDSAHHQIASLLRDHQVYIDSIPIDYKNYYYRVQGINAFGEKSAWSASIKVQGRDLQPPTPPVIDSANNTTGTVIRLAWSQRSVPADLAGYYISRASNVKGPFYPLTKGLLSKDLRSFTDTAAMPHTPNYYVVMAVDTARNISASAAFAGYLKDTTAPATPVGVAGTIDSNGNVHLHWAANKESDLKGYKVYYGYDPRHEFSQRTRDTVAENSFTDSISMRSLDRAIYYKVVAVDRSNNHSSYSAPALLKKPVVVPPSAPVAGSISVAGHRVSIEWIESRSKGAMDYEIFRRGPDTVWRSVGRLNQDWNKGALSFIDTSIALNTDYYYAAETIDSTASRSTRSFAVHVRSHAVDSLSSVGSLQAALNKGQHSIALNWQYQDGGGGDYFFIVYRGVNGGGMEPWHSFEKTAHSGEDAQVQRGTYAYAIKVIHRDKPAASIVQRGTYAYAIKVIHRDKPAASISGKPVIIKVDN